METDQSIKHIRLFKILLGITLLTVFALAMLRVFDHDELEAIHSAWKISTGETIYTDFFQHHHPFFYYTIAPLIQLIGENTVTPLVLRALMFMCYLVMLWSAYQLSAMLFNDQRLTWLSMLLLACLTMFSQKAFEVRPDVPQVTLALLAIVFLWKHQISANKLMYYASAVLVGLSYLFLQKTIFIIAGMGLLQLYWIYEKKSNWLQLISYWILFGATIAPYYLYLLTTHQLESYLFWNWILNMNFEGSFPAVETILKSTHYNHFIWIFFIVGTIGCWKLKKYDLLIICFTLLGTVFLVKAPYRQYFMPFDPFFCAIAAYGMLTTIKGKRLVVLVVLTFLVPMGYYILSIIKYPNQPQLDKIEWVLQNTTESDYVYDGDIYFNLYRKDIDFFWYSTEPGKGGLGTYQRLKPYTYDINAAIRKYRPKVVSTTYVENQLEAETMTDYSLSEKYPDLYIRKD